MDEKINREGNGVSFKKDNQSLKNLFEDRIISMSQIREEMEELFKKHKDEEMKYKDYMQTVLKGTNFLSGNQDQKVEILKKKMSELEKKYEEECAEKKKIEEQFNKFKKAGNSIIGRLRSALTQITEKYKNEVRKSKMVVDKKREIDSYSENKTIQKLKAIAENSQIEKTLCEERIKKLEEENERLKELLKEKETKIEPKIEEYPKENEETHKNEEKKEEDSQKKLINFLLDKLKTEEEERLKTEEQSAAILKSFINTPEKPKEPTTEIDRMEGLSPIKFTL